MPWRLDAVLLALMLIIQLGFSYWISVSSLSVLLVIFRLREQLVTGAKAYAWVAVFPLLMAMSLVVEPSNDLQQDMLRTAREAVFAMLMIWIIAGVTLNPPRINIDRLSQCLKWMVLFLLGITAIQTVLLSRGIYFGFPAEFYVFGVDTIPDELDLRYSVIRPAATFSEPSYLAFISLSLLLGLAGRIDRDRGGLWVALAAIVVGLMSRSASFVLFLFVTGAPFVVRTIKGANKLLVLALVMFLAVAGFGLATLVFGAEVAVLDRVQQGSSGGDASIFVRIFGPLSMLPSYIAYHPIGLPDSRIKDVIAPVSLALGYDPGQYRMNGLINMFFQYGVFGFPLAVLFLVRRDLVVSAFLLSCMMFNGGFLTMDKLVVMCVMIGFYHAMRQQPDANSLDEAVSFRADKASLQRGVTAGAGETDASNDGGDDGRSWAERRQDRRTRDLL